MPTRSMITESHSIRRIGLVADTHGNFAALKHAAETLLQNGAQHIIHLGDFCDSVYRDQLAQVFDLLQDYQIRAVKGNNDYQVEKMLENGYMPKDPKKKAQWLAYLRNTPILYKIGNICFSHSMPYDSVRAFYEPVDTGGIDGAQKVFADTGYRLIFCGHSHSPVFFRQAGGLVSREQIRQGAAMAFKPDERYIVIVGAADNAECGLFDLENASYKRICIS